MVREALLAAAWKAGHDAGVALRGVGFNPYDASHGELMAQWDAGYRASRDDREGRGILILRRDMIDQKRAP